MVNFLKGLGVLAAIGAVVAVGYGLVLLIVAALPFIIVGATYLAAAVVSIAIIMGVIATFVYVAKEIGKSTSKK